MVIPGRSFSSGSYRYGFNGQEKSDELIAGNYTAEFWQYDSRIGRRWNLDPIDKEDVSGYSVFVNNPIIYSDPYGLDTINFNKQTTIYIPKQSSFSGGGQQLSGSTSFSINVIQASGKDVYLYNNTLTKISGSDDKITTTTTSTILHPENRDAASGVTKGLNLYFDGLWTTERKNNDWESVGKFMDFDKGFYNYMIARNPNAKGWNEKAASISVMEGLMPAAVKSGFGAFLGYRFGGASPNITYSTKAGKYPSWNTVKARYWNLENGGKVPTGKAMVRMRTSGEIREITVSKELHHINGRTSIDPHSYSNLKQVWPWEHAAIDPSRNTGYDFLKWVK